MSENRLLRIFDPRGQKQPRTSEKITERISIYFLTSITEVDRTEKNWYIGHARCEGKTREILKISMNFSLCETKIQRDR